MTINDADLNYSCLKVRQLAETLPKLMRDGQTQLLFLVLHEISNQAEKGKERLNRIEWLPTREPMGA